MKPTRAQLDFLDLLIRRGGSMAYCSKFRWTFIYRMKEAGLIQIVGAAWTGRKCVWSRTIITDSGRLALTEGKNDE